MDQNSEEAVKISQSWWRTLLRLIANGCVTFKNMSKARV
jgi:hypothetical protein